MARRNNMTRKNRNRKNRKSMKGGADAPAPSTADPTPVAVAPPAESASASQAGGKRKTRKGGKGRKLSSGARVWQDHMMSTYREMKARNPNTRLGDAMKAAKKTFRK
jgi:hypothetical protein